MLAFKPHRRAFQVAFSPDGASIATSGERPFACVSDAATGRPLWSFTPNGAPTIGLGLAFSPNGSRLAVVDWRHVRVFDSRTGELLHTHPGRGYAVAFTRTGRGLVTAPRAIGEDAIVTDIASGSTRPLPVFNSIASCNRCVFSPDGKTVAGVTDRSFSLLTSATGRLIRGETLTTAAAGCGVLAFHPHGRTLVYSDGPKLILYDLAAMKSVGLRKRSAKYFQDGAFTTDGRHFITVSNDAAAVVWETAGWTEVRSFAWDIGPLKSVAVSPDGTRAVCASDRGRVVVWDLDL